MTLLERINKTWFRHILTLRPFLHVTYHEKGVGLGLMVKSVWDEGWHANHPLVIELLLAKWTVQFGIKDTN